MNLLITNIRWECADSKGKSKTLPTQAYADISDTLLTFSDDQDEFLREYLTKYRRNKYGVTPLSFSYEEGKKNGLTWNEVYDLFHKAEFLTISGKLYKIRCYVDMAYLEDSAGNSRQVYYNDWKGELPDDVVFYSQIYPKKEEK